MSREGRRATAFIGSNPSQTPTHSLCRLQRRCTVTRKLRKSSRIASCHLIDVVCDATRPLLAKVTLEVEHPIRELLGHDTVDVANATWTNTIGATELITVWRDPDFDPALRAFYYARVVEIPPPRWTAYDANFYDITMPEDVPMVIQERAYTSPIWYTP